MMTLRPIAACAAGVVTLGVGQAADAQCDELDFDMATLVAGDAQAADQFGFAVDVSGNAAIVGARLDDDHGLASGSAYVFRYDGDQWYQEQKLVPDDGWGADQFGSAVAISGNVAVVGAYLDDDNGSASGSTYVFRYDGSEWVEDAKLSASDGSASDLFGYSVTVDGDLVVVGAYQDTNDNGWYGGAAYVFSYDGSSWGEGEKLMANEYGPGVRFGYAVGVTAISNRIAVGAFYDDDAGSGSGSVYVFRDEGWGWEHEAKVVASDPYSLDQFGNAVAIEDDLLVVGSYEDDDDGAGSGSVYVYRHNGSSWSQEQKLHASDAWTQDHFGISVAVSDDVIAVGAYGNDDAGIDSGSAYVFRNEGGVWIEESKLVSPDGAIMDNFGQSVGVSGGLVVVGSYLDDSPAFDAGSACMFSSAGADGGGPDCNENGIPDWCDIENGDSPDVNSNGVPDECEEITDPDINGDGIVNVLDLMLLVTSWGICEGPCPEDINGDGVVDVTDLTTLLELWNL